MKNIITIITVRCFAKHFHAKANRVNAMPTNTIDQVAKASDAFDALLEEFHSLPEWLQNAVGNSRESEIA